MPGPNAGCQHAAKPILTQPVEPRNFAEGALSNQPQDACRERPRHLQVADIIGRDLVELRAARQSFKIGAVAATIMIPTALFAQMGSSVNPGAHIGGAVNPGATVRG